MNQNIFSNKMIPKSNHELIEIISSDRYVENAKQAAAWELEKRNIKHDYQTPKQDEKGNYRESVINTKKSRGSKKYYENRFLVYGLSCIVVAIYYFAPTVFTTNKSLIPINGNLNNAKIIIDNVSSTNKYGYESKSRRATLYFSLIDDKRSFKLAENIGQQYSHDKYSHLKDELEKSDDITIWIKSNESDIRNPKVFQIDVNNKTVLTLEEVKSDYSFLFFFLLILGLVSILIILLRNYPNYFILKKE